MTTNNRRGTDRRNFLKTGTTALAAGAVAAPGLSFARSVHVAGSQSVRIGLVGCGGRGRGAATQALNTTSSEVSLVAAADIFADRITDSLESIASNSDAHREKVRVDDDHRFVGFDAFQRLIESDVDLVILATPPGFRPLHFEKAVEAGKHIFMEKPVAVDAPGVRRVLAANERAREKGLLVQVGLQRHHEPPYIETIARLRDGAIGDINLMRCYWNADGVWVNPRRPEQTELEYQCFNWYYFNWLCGDHIVEQHIHNIDVCNWLKDAHPVSAQGQGGRQVRTGKQYGQIFDHHMVEFTYADGSVMLSQCRHIPGCDGNVSEHAHGSEGYCNISAGRIFDRTGNTVFEAEGPHGRGHQDELHDLFRTLASGTIVNEGEYGALSTMTAILGRMATYTGRTVTWDEAFTSELSLCDVDSLTSFDSPAPVQPDGDGRYPVATPGKNFELVL